MDDQKKVFVIGAVILIAVAAAFFSFRQSGVAGQQEQVIGSLSDMEKNSQNAASGTAEKDPSMP